MNATINSFQLSQSDYDAAIASYVQAFQDRREYYMGPIVLAVALDQILFGVLVLEVWSYFKWFRDARMIRVLVILLLLLNVAQTATNITYSWTMFARFYADYEKFTTGLYIDTTWLFEATVGVLSQLFFLQRAYKLTKKNKILLITCLFTIITGFGTGTATFIWLVGILGGDAVYNGRATGLVVTWKALTLATDVMLTGSIVFSLLRSKTGWKRTDETIGALIRFTCEAQVLPSLAAFGFLVSYVLDPGGSWPALFSYAETKLYAISVCHVLNSRGSLRRDFQTTERSSDMGYTGETPRTNHRTGGIGGKSIQIHTQTIIHTSSPTANVESVKNVGDHTITYRSTGAVLHDEDEISLETFEEHDLERGGDRRRSHDGASMKASETGASQAELIQQPALPY